MKSPINRRNFLRTTTATLGAAAIAPTILGADGELAKPADPAAESLVKQLYLSLNDEQKEAICFDFGSKLQSRVENNWHITASRIGSLLDMDQQALVRQIFTELHSEEYRDDVWRAFMEDNRTKRENTPEKAFGSASIAIFGTPDVADFELVFTARHCTRRCDGNSVAGAAFGGPIFYGHASQGFNEGPKHPENAYWFQAEAANGVYEMLDGKQREKALLEKARPEAGVDTVALKHGTDGLEGLAAADLSADQKAELRKTLAALLAPFRKEDREESMKFVDPQFDDLHLAFFKEKDLGGDGVWDIWQVEGPSMIWYFRGAPHVHTWVNIEKPAAAGDAFG